MHAMTLAVSVILSALFTNSGEGFVEPKANAKLQALLAEHPKLDLFETAALGTSQQLEAMLRDDPSAIAKQTSFGWTLLHLAAFAGNAENTELLIRRGANLETRAKSKFRKTPLAEAVRGKHEELAAWLKTKGAVIEPVAGE